MKVELWCINKNTQSYVVKGIEDYASRIKHYLNFDIHYFSVLRPNARMSLPQMMKAEGKLIESKRKQGDYLILLDERGKQYNSVEFSRQLEKWKMNSFKRLVFVVGGGYGFDPELKQRADHLISLSKMTFPHSLVRIIFLEQLYRACTIEQGQKYHHE